MSAAPFASRRIVIERCPLCTALPRGPWFDGGGFEWVLCDCGLVYKRAEEVHAEAVAAGHYDDAYFERYARRRRRRVAKSRLQILDALEACERGRLLDVGCSLGYTLEAARSLGLDAVGVDGAAPAVAECQRRGFDAFEGGLETLPFDNASFAVVMLKHVFEHTPEPRRALAELRRVLRPGGAAFFAVPHLDYRHAGNHPSRSRFFRGEAARAHYVYYRPATLSRLLEEEGFRVDSVHPRLVHYRAGWLRRSLEAALISVRFPLRAIRDALALRKEFWLVAVRR